MSSLIANRRIVTNSLWIIAEKSFRFALGILVLGLVARYLGAELFGQLNFSIAVLAIARVAASVGMNRIFPREIVAAVGDKTVRAEIISTVFFIRLAVAILVIALLFAYSYLLSGQHQALFFLIVASVLFSPFDVIDLHQQGLARVKGISIIRSLVFVMASSVKVVLVLIEADVVWFFAIVLIEHCVLGICFYGFITKQQGIGFLSHNRCKLSRLRSLLSESWPEIIAGLGGIMFMRLDQVMLQFMHGAESVGIYSAAVRISEAWYFFPMAIISATFPKIIQLRVSSAQRYMDSMLILFSVLVGISVLATVFFVTFSQEIVGIVFGPDFAESSMILQIHCLTAIFIFLGSASGSWLAAEKKLVWNLHRNMVGLVMNIVFNLILIERYGAIGAALATLISVAFAFYFFDLFSPKLRFMFRLKSQAVLTLGISGALLAWKHREAFRS